MKTLIFEPGRSVCKGGEYDDILPSVEIPSVCFIKTPKENKYEINNENNCEDHSIDIYINNKKDVLKPELKIFVGHEAIEEIKDSKANLIYPLNKNLVMSDWRLCELIWDKVLLELGINQKGRQECHDKILVIIPSSGGKLIKEKVDEWLKKKYFFREIIYMPSYLLSLYSYGKDTGIVVDIGTFWTTITPVIEGVSDENSSLNIPIGGRILEDYLKILLSRRGLNFTKRKHPQRIEETKDDILVRKILQESCFVTTSESITHELISNTTSYLELIELKDHNKYIFLEEERFQVTENVFFKPFSIGIESLSICEAIFKVINKCPLDTRVSLMENIFLTGGSSLFIGLPQRIQANLTKLFLDNKLMGDIERLNKYKINLIDDPIRDLSNFKGANIYLQLIH